MDEIMNKFGSFYFKQRANKEISSAGDDMEGMFGCSENSENSKNNENSAVPIHPNILRNSENSAVLAVLAIPTKVGIAIGALSNTLSTSIQDGAKWLVNKMKGKMQKPLPELLREYDLPAGLFPRDATHYEFNEETKKIIVYVPSICEVPYRDSSVVRFDTTVTGRLEKGKLLEIEGMKTKVLIWSNVIYVKTEGSKVQFKVGVKKNRPRDVYEVLKDGIPVEEF